MKHRKLITTAGAALLALSLTISSFAGLWQQDDNGWWYQEGDGSYPVETWKWIDGNNDGISESYYFDSNGYLVISATTPDGYQVNENGAWILNGEVQMQKSATYAETSVLYTYKEMQKDLSQLESRFPNVPILVESLAQTIDEREIYHIVVGEENASKHVLITGSTHAREYITTQLVMKQLLDLCEKYQEYAQLNDESVAFHFVPMVNPDGVTLSQFGLDGIKREDVKQTILQIAEENRASKRLSEYFTKWKANARGTDLNRNFDAIWGKKIVANGPASSGYNGSEPHSEIESKALVDLTLKAGFDLTINYHTQGEVIYWYFGQSGAFLEESTKLANLGKSMTGYKLIDEHESMKDGSGGYKDWAIAKLGIPGLTIEIGKGENPVPHEQLTKIWEQNKELIPRLMKEFL